MTEINPHGQSAPKGGVFARIENELGVTVAGVVVAGLAIVGWWVAHLVGGRELFLFAYGAALTVGVSIGLARRRRPVTAVRSDLARRARVGQTLQLELQLESSLKVTAFQIEEQLPPTLGRSVTLAIPSISPGETLKHRYSITPRVRGVYRIGPMVAEFSDPMGLAKRRQELIGQAEVIVHPNVEEVIDRPLTRAFEDPPLRPPKSRPWPQGMEFYGMHDYVPGDDTRRIVWRAFARTDRLLVRESEQGVSDRIAIVIDTDEAWHSSGDPSDTFETAVRAAASVGVKHIKDGFTVRLEANYERLGGFRGPSSRLQFLDELARIHLGREPLSGAMERLAKTGRRDDHVVVVTSHFDARSAASANLMINDGASFTICAIVWDESDPLTIRRASEVGAQVVQIKSGSALSGVFRASLMTNTRVYP